MQDLRRITVCLLLACVLLLAFRGASAQTPEPLTEAKIVTALKSGGITQPRLVTLVNERGVDFALTPRAEQRLRSAGAGDELIAAIRKAKVKTAAKPTTEPSSRPSGTTATKRVPATDVSQASGASVGAPQISQAVPPAVSQLPSASGGAIKSISAEAFYEQGMADLKKNDYDRAIQDFDQAIKLKPDYAEAFKDRGRAYSAKGEYDRAIQDDDQAIRLKPDYAMAFYNRGIEYSRKGEPDRAIQDYDQAIRLKPDDANAFFNRGLAYYEKGEYDRAIQDCDQAIRIQADYADAYFLKGWVLSHRATLSKDGKMAFPAGTAESLHKYLELAPTGRHAQDARELLATMGR